LDALGWELQENLDAQIGVFLLGYSVRRMADFVFNAAKGRIAEIVRRIDANEPADSALVIVALKATGLEADATLRDYETLATLLAATNDEATNTGYERKLLTDTELVAPVPDQVNDRMDVDIPDLLWTAVQATGGAWGKLLVCYDSDSTGGTDANIVPLTGHDFAVTPDGSDISAQIAASGFFRAS
jgi:hypothetical protein